MRITVQMPTGTAVLDVAENVLVFNGEDYVKPEYAQYLELYTLPIKAMSNPMRDLAFMLMTTYVRIQAKVLDLDPTVVPVTSPGVVEVADPTDGECVCGITCEGTNIRFAVVQPEN